MDPDIEIKNSTFESTTAHTTKPARGTNEAGTVATVQSKCPTVGYGMPVD